MLMIEYKRRRLASYQRMAQTHATRAERLASDPSPRGRALVECHAAIAKRCGREADKLTAQVERLESTLHGRAMTTRCL